MGHITLIRRFRGCLMRRLSDCKVAAFAFLFAAAVPVIVGAVDPVQKSDGVQQRDGNLKADRKSDRQTLITISKETTHLTEPLTEDGFVDYLKAVNARMSEGVTVENNAAVFLMRAFGPATIEKSMRKEFFARLGIPVLPEDGAYLESIDQFATRAFARSNPGRKPVRGFDVEYFEFETALNEEQWFTAEQPWKSQEHPLVVEWLKRNEKPLKLVVEATQRSKFYRPVVGTEKHGRRATIAGSFLDGFHATGTTIKLLATRSMLNLGEGRVFEAQRDALTAHRFARLIGRGPTLIDGLEALRVDMIACSCDRAIAEHGGLTHRQAATFRESITNLPLYRGLAEYVDSFARLTYLDLATFAAREDNNGLRERLGIRMTPGAVVNWNAVLRAGNRKFDRIAEAARKPTHAERMKAVNRVDSSRPAVDFLGLPLIELTHNADAKSIGSVLFDMVLSSPGQTFEVFDRRQQRIEHAELAYALAGFRAERGVYPARLSELVPRYIPEIPADVFSAKPLLHERRKDGYLLYSVGVNLKDEGGAAFVSQPPGDDVVVRVPSKQRGNRESRK